MKISELTQRIAIALLIVVGAVALSSFIIGQYDPNQWPDSVRLSFAIGIILTIVVIVMHHKAQERQKVAYKKKEEAKFAAKIMEEKLKEREKAIELIEKENQHQEALLNSPAMSFASNLNNMVQKQAMQNFTEQNTMPAIAPTIAPVEDVEGEEVK